MNERDFFYSEPDSAVGGDTAGEATPEVADATPVAQENAAPVASSSMATTDPTSSAQATASTEPTTEQVVSNPTAVETNVQAESLSAVPPASDSPSDSTSQSSGEAVAEPAPTEPKQPAVVITDETLARLQQICDNKEIIQVVVTERIRGGLRVAFENVKMFLPASQYTVKKSPSDEELQSAVGTTITAQISQIEKDDTGKISFICSRKNILKEEFIKSINVGDTVQGTVASVMPFGVFVDIGGFDGLIHISRISRSRIDDPNTRFKKGDQVTAKIIEIDLKKDKIGLSTREFEPSPWENIAQEVTAGTTIKGKVRRLADFGAFVEVRPGVDGMLRISELSWGTRINHPSEVVQVGQELDLYVIEVNPEKQQIALSLRRTLPSPWAGIESKFPLGAETAGVVKQVIAQGVVITIGGEYDGFMPRSKMRDIIRGNRIPYNQGDMVSVVVADVNGADQTLILAPKVDPNSAPFGGERGGRRRDGEEGDRAPRNVKIPREQEASSNTTISIMDLLSDTEKNNLFNKGA